MEGSGFPVARHTRVTLLPSFTTMSLEIRNIFGETGRKQGESCNGKLLNQCNPVRARRAEESWDTHSATVGKNTCGCWNITMQKPCSGVSTAISITFAEAQLWIWNATNKKGAISSILCKAAIVIEFPVNCYWWMLLFKRRLSLLVTVWKEDGINFFLYF